MMQFTTNRMRRFTSVMALVVALGAGAWAISQETVDAIGAAVAIGTAINTGEITPELAAKIVQSFQKDKLTNAQIRDIFASVADTAALNASSNRDFDTGPGNHGNRGMGAFVQDAHARGLKGRDLADAIHAEQARRGMSGNFGDHAKMGRGMHDDDSDTKHMKMNNSRGESESAGHPKNMGNSENKNRGRR